MRWSGWIPATALGIVVGGCGGKLLPLPVQQDGGGVGTDSGSIEDASVDGDGSRPDGPPTDERGPPPVPVCTGQNSMCIPPEAGLSWTGVAVIQCQGEQYVGPWTLVLERLIGTTYQVVQKQVVQEPGFGWTFYDSSGPPARLTYKVCVVLSDGTAECGAPFTTQGPSNCACEPTSCYLQTACNTKIDNQCMGTIDCGPCPNGMACNPENNTCCPTGFMSDGWGGCVCAPVGCPLWAWDTVTCACMPGP
jgi:hypothetical protein